MFNNKAVIINNKIALRDVPGTPTIIIDKSTLEALSDTESIGLGRYYLAVSTHVLLSEIGADLKKNFDDGRNPEKYVSALSKRMHGLYRFNTDWHTLLRLSLLGYKIPIDSMAPVELGGMETYTPGVGRGIYFDEQEERKTLSDWANGEFSESDYRMAAQWRSEIEDIDLKWLRDLGNKLKSLKIKSLEDLPTTIENLVNDSEYQFEFLQFLVDLADLSTESSTEIFNHWNERDMPRIQHFSQYGYYCLTVYLIFWWALFSGLVGPRSTHCIDLHYLFELPFCYIFSSNDGFHEKFFHLLKTDQQKFIKGWDLKSDLKRIEEYVNSLSEEDITDFFPVPYPPDWDDSFTNQVWRECVMSREEFSKFTVEEEENILKFMRIHQQHNFRE